MQLEPLVRRPLAETPPEDELDPEPVVVPQQETLVPPPELRGVAVGDLNLYAKVATYLKKQPIDSSELHTGEKVGRIAGDSINVVKVRATQGGHVLVDLGYGGGSWWLWRDHWRGWPATAVSAVFTMPLGQSLQLQKGLLTLLEGDRVLIRADATSGVIGGQSAADFNRVGVGPIPPGDQYQIDTYPHYAPDYPGIEGYLYDIYPRSLPNGRSLFAVHFDAGAPGSAGCIVLTNRAQWDQFRAVLKELRDRDVTRIALTVDYGTTPPKPASPSRVQRWAKALAEAKPKGASPATAAQDGIKGGGVAASRQLAQNDLERTRKLLPQIRAAAEQYQLPVAVVAAIGSRESRQGNALDRNGWGDGGWGFGVNQVDRGAHNVVTEGGPFGLPHYLQSVGIFNEYLNAVVRKFPQWPDSELLRAAYIAYNSGLGNVATIENMDKGTTGGDYGSDCVARAQFYSERLD